MPTLGPSDIEQIHDYMHDVVVDITAHMRAEFPCGDHTAMAVSMNIGPLVLTNIGPPSGV